MKSPYYWLCKYREYTFASKTSKMSSSEKAIHVSESILKTKFAYNQDIHILENRIYQSLFYRTKIVNSYPYDYSEMLRWDNLLDDADINFTELIKQYANYAKKQGIKFKKFKNTIFKLVNPDEYKFIISLIEG